MQQVKERPVGSSACEQTNNKQQENPFEEDEKVIMALSNQEIVDALKEKSLLETSELVKMIEETFGVSAAAAAVEPCTPGAKCVVTLVVSRICESPGRRNIEFDPHVTGACVVSLDDDA